MEEELTDNRNKRKLDIDWAQVFPERSDDPPAELIVMKDEPPKASSDDSGSSEESDLKNFSDVDLEQKLKRMKRFYANSRSTLRDKGEKFYRRLKIVEQECERRRLHQPDTSCSGVVGYEKEKNSVISSASNAFKQGSASSQHQARSFGSAFKEKMDNSKNCRVFDKELSTVAVAPCKRRKTKSIEELSYAEGQHPRSSSRQLPFKCAINLSSEEEKSTFSSRYEEEISNNHKKDEFPVLPTNKSRRKKNQTLVLIDEDELPPERTAEETQHTELTDLEDKLDECMKDARIYYPSRDDPESVEICYMDVNNLAPGAYLTSPIMNFYIQYLQKQASPTNRAIYDCHFFNTYFYQKLKGAVSYKGVDKNSFFVKFRRWWKGVNIFQKAYVLIPIHEDLHWSLVIISIPNKEEESGPIILHLDSLGLHSSRSVFDNIRSFLREEWNYMMEKDSPSDLPISDRIWKHLPRRIDEKIIAVPQQKNDYDCGLFVLFFMERFIEEAPERLKKANLAMFGKKWFRPEEASSLRARIRNILKREFELTKADNCIAQSH